MKKFLSLVLALVMALSLTTVAWGVVCTDDPCTTHKAAFDGEHYATLQEAVDAAEVVGGTITLLADCGEDVVVEQAAGVAIVIDGAYKTYTGTITVDGKSAAFPTADLKIQNVNFDTTSITKDAYINLGKGGDNNTRYTNNVTVKDCTFSYSGSGDVVAIKSYTGGDKNLTVEGCIVNSGMHSLLQVKNVETGVKIIGCKVYSKEGVNLNSTPALEMSGCEFDVQGYAVRVGVNGTVNTTEKSFTITGSTLKSACADGDAVIVFRDDAKKADVTITDTTLTGPTTFAGNEDVTEITVDGVPTDAVAQVGSDYFDTLTDAMKAVTSGATLTLLKDVTISEDWDCRFNGAQILVPVTIDGDGHKLTFTGKVDDKNWNTVFRFEETATVKNLTIDASAATGIQRGITSKGSIVVENFTFIGNGTSARYGVIFGEGAGSAISNVTATVTGSTFENTSYGVSDNRNGQDAKSVTVTDSTFTNAAVLLSASESVTFNDNTVEGKGVSITSYSSTNELAVTATGNTLDADEDNQIVAATITAQDGFVTPVGEVGGKYYTSLQDVVDKTAAGGTVTLLRDCDDDVTVGKALTFDFNGYTYSGVVTPAAGYTYMDGVVKKTPAASGTTSTGSVTSGTVTATKAKMYRLATAGTSMTELFDVTKIEKTTVTGKLVNDVPAYVPNIYKINDTTYYVEVAKADATFALKNNGVYVYLVSAGTASNVDAVIAKFATAVVLDQYVAAAEDVACGDAIKGTKGAAIYKSGNDAYYADGSNWAVFKGEFVTYDKNTKVAYKEHKWDAKSIIVKATDVKGTKVPVTIKCEDCEKTFSIVPSAKFDNTWVKGVNYTTDKAVDKYNTAAVKYYIVLENATYTGTYVPSVPSTDKVQSADTFDAGIAMYVGMSVMAAAGSAVVLKKRED